MHRPASEIQSTNPPAAELSPEPASGQATPEDVDLSCESVAGEEDPGASLDLSEVPEPQPQVRDQKVPE